MRTPSYNTPPVFSAFTQQRMAIARQNRMRHAPTHAEEPVHDVFLDPQQSISAKRAVSLFLLGLGVALAGRGVLSGLLERTGLVPKNGPVKFNTDNFMKGLERNGQAYMDEMNLSQGFDGLSSVYMLALRDTHQRKALLAYLGSMILGYLGGSVAQGSQEAWVRHEETKIRAHLINRMTNVFRQSIRNKNATDTRIKKEAQDRILDLLKRYQVPHAEALIQDRPLVESNTINQRYFFEPTHRTMPASLQFGNEPAPATAAPQPDQKPHLALIQAGIVAAGLFTGLTLQAFLRLFTGHLENGSFKGKIINYETIRINALESFIIHGSATRQNLFIMGGFFAMAAGAKLGKLLIDGLREIEVTRVNAHTELAYQTHNWLTQDPAFHEIAETEALNHSLTQLEQDLPFLKNDPATLKQRIQTILTNVGRNSAPKYFPMTPPVGLVVARA